MSSISKNVIYLIPIGIITSNLYISRYGDYNFPKSFRDAISYFSGEKTIFCIVVFCILFLIAYQLQNRLMPLTAILFISPIQEEKYNLESYNQLKNKIQKVFSLNPDEIEKKIDLLDFYSDICYLPVLLILWALCLNNVFGIALSLLMILGAYFLGKIFNTVYKNNSFLS